MNGGSSSVRGRVQQPQRLPNGLQRVAAAGQPGGRMAGPDRLAVALGQGGRRAHADEGVARPDALLGRLQEVAARTVPGQLAVQADRRLGVREQPAVDRDHPPAGGQRPELLQRRAITSFIGASSGCRDDGGQLPGVEAGAVAGMAGRALLVHLDQQAVAVAVQPDLAHPLPVPAGLALDPVLLRLREKNVDRPVVRVRCSASSSIQPTIKHLAGRLLLDHRGRPGRRRRA